MCTIRESVQVDGMQDRSGQTLAEYALILTFVALAAVGGVALLGGSVLGLFSKFNGSY